MSAGYLEIPTVKLEFNVIPGALEAGSNRPLALPHVHVQQLGTCIQIGTVGLHRILNSLDIRPICFAGYPAGYPAE